jgi:hypothetical protein
MSTQNYHCSITAAVSIAQAIACINNVAGWWSANIEGNTARLNDEFVIHFGEAFVNFKVTGVEGKERHWLVTDCYLHWLADKTEWKGTEVLWQLSEDGGATRIDFTHIGLTPQVECYDGCVKGWDQYVKDSLLKLITEGKGQPQGVKVPA